MVNMAGPVTKKRGFPWGWLVVGVAVGAAIYWGPGLFKHKDAAAPQGGGMPASVAAVVSKSIMPWSEFSGRLEAVQSAEIRPQVSGVITQVLFKDGEEVKKGQPLFVIDPRPYEAQLASAKGAASAAESAFATAKLDYARAQQLIKMKAISQSEFETRSNALKQASGSAEEAAGALKVAQVNLGYTHIVAPISGKISRAEITPGNLVSAANAPLLASIVTLSPLYASFELDEETFLHTIQGVPTAKLKTIPVEIGLSGDTGTPIQATVHAFDNQLAAGTGTIRVRALVPNKDERLVPGLFARVRIGTPGETQAILINPTAVGTDQNKKFVFVVNGESKTEYREVHLGTLVDGLQIVTSGLNEGDQIVVNGLQRLRPGTPVTPVPTDMTTLKPLNAAPNGEAPAPAADAAPAAAAQ